jgi:hypothetical protein
MLVRIIFRLISRLILWPGPLLSRRDYLAPRLRSSEVRYNSLECAGPAALWRFGPLSAIAGSRWTTLGKNGTQGRVTTPSDGQARRVGPKRRQAAALQGEATSETVTLSIESLY